MKKQMPTGGVIQKVGSTVANKTGGWRTFVPKWDKEKCKQCMICWQFCPDDSIPVKDGKRLERIIKQMETRMKLIDVNDEDQVSLYLAYCDRLIRATATKVNIAETVLGIKAIINEAKKTLPKPQMVKAEVNNAQ